MHYDKQALARLDDAVLDWRFRSIPQPGIRLADVAAQQWRLRSDGLLLPAAVLRGDALDHNIQLMRSYCRAAGVELAPHAKTHMSPQLLARQVDAGAWAVTVATVAQARVFRSFGFNRFLIANQVLEPAAVAWVASALAEDDLQLVCLVDDAAAVSALDGRLQAAGAPRPLDVLLEVGYLGGRAGVRSVEAAISVAEAVGRADRLQLVGVEGFEGLMPTGRVEPDPAPVRVYLDTVLAVAEKLDELGLYASDDVVLSAGGSSLFDLVIEAFEGVRLQRQVTRVLRSGCYVTHDHGAYRATSPLDGRANGGSRLRPALEIWAPLLSRPEPDHVIVGMGKRDVGFDSGLPPPQMAWRAGERIDVGDGAATVALNDQHAVLRVDPGAALEPGDRVVFGTSHPCATFDRWPLLLLADERDVVVDAYLTFF